MVGDHQMSWPLAIAASWANLSRLITPQMRADPREAPPVTDPAAVDAILEVVAMAGGKIGCALSGQAIEPSMVLRRQVVVGKVVKGCSPIPPGIPR
jgi:hypothetical protein